MRTYTNAIKLILGVINARTHSEIIIEIKQKFDKSTLNSNRESLINLNYE